MTTTGQSLYDKLGADVGITKAVDEFYNRVVTDPDLAQFFSDVDMASLRRHQVAMLSVATGGPAQYTGRDMETAHAGLGITDAHLDRVAEHLAGTLTHLAVDNETISEVAAALTPFGQR